MTSGKEKRKAAEIEGGLINQQEAVIRNLGDALTLGERARVFVSTNLLVAHTAGKNLSQFGTTA